MQTEGILRYRNRVSLWLSERRQAGGTLSQEEEARHTGDVDEIWRTLSGEERDCLDRESRCRCRVWRKGRMTDCGGMDESSLKTGICQPCASRELPIALELRQKAAAEFEAHHLRVLQLEIAANPAAVEKLGGY